MTDGISVSQNALSLQFSQLPKPNPTRRKSGLGQGHTGHKCNWCFADKETMFIYGHEQFGECGTNVVECCLGSYR